MTGMVSMKGQYVLNGTSSLPDRKVMERAEIWILGRPMRVLKDNTFISSL